MRRLLTFGLRGAIAALALAIPAALALLSLWADNPQRKFAP